MNETRQINHDFVLHLFKGDDSPLGQARMEVDWDPALESCHLSGIRRGKLPPMHNIGTHRIEPIWDAEKGKPSVAGFRTVISEGNGSEGFSSDFPITYFADQALRESQCYVRTGRLNPGDRIRYRITASPGTRATEPETGASRPRGFSVREVPKPIPLGSVSLHRLRDESVPFDGGEEEDMPVFIPDHVLNEVCSRTREGGAYEVGSILLGHLHRDTESPEIIAEVTAAVPIPSPEQKLYSLSITAESWAEVRNTIRLRDKQEIMVGWAHSHSFMKEVCQNCKRVEDKSCDHTAVYMSEKDCGLHRTAFYRAYNLALVLGDTPCTGLNYGLFGWRYGGIHRRGFRILNTGRSGANMKGEENVG